MEEQRISNRMIHCDGFAYRKKDIFKSSNLSISTNPWVAGSNPVGSTKIKKLIKHIEISNNVSIFKL